MKTGLKDRLFYAIGGGTGSNLGFHIMNLFFIIFCVDVWGLNPIVASTVVLVTRLVDVFTDPLMGAIADKTRTRLGKYRFWVMVAGPLTGLMTFLVFLAPDIPPFAKIIYIYVVYIAYSIISTAANIPYHSLTAYITDDPKQRRVLVIIKQSAAMVVVTLLQIVGVYITITLFDNEPIGYRVLGAIAGIGIAISFLLCGYGARHADNVNTLDPLDKDGQYNYEKKFTFKDFVSQLSLIVKSPSLRNLSIATSTNFFATTIVQAVSIYFYTIVLGDVLYIQVAAIFGLVFALLSFVLAYILSNKIGNKETFVYSTYGAVIIGVVTFIIFNPDQPMLMVFLISLGSVFSGVGGVATFMMVTDCADEIKLETGENGAGIASSCLTFANKLGSAIGGFSTGFVLVLIGYNADLATQPESVAVGLTVAVILGPVLGHIFSILSMRGYPLSKKRHTEILNELNK